MRYHILASDYDGTLAHHGRVDEPTLRALERLLATGRRLVLVTGRELPELLQIFPEIELFEWVVAENGGLLYSPSTKEEKVLAERPPQSFVDELHQRGVHPISVGRAIVATWEPHQSAVLETIHQQGLELQVIFNKGAVMVLPAGVNKASGFRAALREMGMSPHNAVGVGDAENDHALLKMCEFSAAVANALPAVKETADLATSGDHGAGVVQLIEALLEDDLARFEGRLARHHLAFGSGDGGDVAIPAYGPSLLICGPSASGKSTVATRVLESLVERQRQFCLIDPEGDYEAFEGAVVFGGPHSLPSAEEILRLLSNPHASAVVSLTGMPIPDRPPFFLSLWPRLLQMRARTGRPHWLVLDEAHHLMPAEWLPPAGVIPEKLRNLLLITVHPELLSPQVLDRIDALAAVGDDAAQTLADFARAARVRLPAFHPPRLEKGEVLMWRRKLDSIPARVRVHPCRTERRRHRRKYAEGELPPERSFYFRGPQGKLNLRAQNLMLFLQIADGVDDDTWEHHRRQHDYSQWFRDCIKDDHLAAEAARIEGLPDVSADESRALLRAAVERDYTLPASPPLPVPEAS